MPSIDKAMLERREAFSLLELLIVIMIISLSYMLVFSSMQKASTEPKALTPLNLKSTLLENEAIGDRELFCIENSRQCFIYKDGAVTPYKGKLSLKDIIVYKINSDN
nr:type II secretion system protein [Sulfurovaceae bacterium]